MDGRLSSSSSGTKFCVDKNKQGGGYTVTMATSQDHVKVNQGKEPGSDARSAARSDAREDEALCANSSTGKNTLVLNRHKTKAVGHLASLKGQVVIARDKTDGIYYKGVVMSTPTPRCAMVRRFYDGEVSRLNTRFLLPVKGAISYPPLRTGDHVLVQVLTLNDSRESYIPGMIQMTSNSAGVCLSTILLYNRQTIVTSRRHIVKISKERFDFSVDHICREWAQDREPYRNQEVQSRTNVQNNGTTTQNLFVNEYENNSALHKERTLYITKIWGDKEKYYAQRNHERDQHFKEKHDHCKQAEDEKREGDGHVYEQFNLTKHSNEEYQNDNSDKEQLSDNSDKERLSDNSYEERLNDNSIQEHGIKQGKQRRTKHESRKDGMKTRMSVDAAGVNGGNLRAQLSEQGMKLRELHTELQEQSHQHRRHREAMKRKLKVLKKDYRQKTCQGTKMTAEQSVNLQEEKETDDDDRKTLALLEMRKCLPQIKEQEDVLARWSDEGWYYRCVIKANCQDFSYLVMDSTGDVQQTWREDILTESNDINEKVMIEDKVIALHPDYSFMYAPATVSAIYSDLTIQVLFYDNVMAELHRDEIYKIPDFKYSHDVKELKKKEILWKGQSVVARKDNMGVYCIGCVLQKVEDKHLYSIQWHDGTVCEQRPQHMFGAFTRRHKVTIGDRILAVQNVETYTYLPGNVIGEGSGKLNVKFCDGSQGVVRPEESYWLSDTYFDEAVKNFKGD